jgi:hypothetical protein
MASNVIPWNRDQPAEQADLGPAGTTNQRKDGASPWRRARFLVFIAAAAKTMLLIVIGAFGLAKRRPQCGGRSAGRRALKE